MKRDDSRSNVEGLARGSVLGAGVLMIAIAGASSAALAQSASYVKTAPGDDNPQGGGGDDVQEVLVTARRATERLQDVPVAVAALSAKDLVEAHIETESDLQSATPGLTVRQSSSSNQLNFSLRGQSVDAFSYSAPAVLTYFNEVQTGGVTATSFFDLDSVQVLKGPQGTLFGRNATGGAVLYKSHAPTDVLEGYVRVGYGNYDNREAQGALNVPFGDTIAVRVAGDVHQRDGFQHNLYNGEWLNSIDSGNIRTSLLIKPAGTPFQNLTVYQYGRYAGNSGGVRLQNAYPVGATNNGYPLNTTAAALYPPGFLALTTDPRVVQLGFNGVFDFLAKEKGIGFYDVYNDANGRHRANQNLVSNTSTYDLSEALNFKDIVGYNYTVSRDKTDTDGSPFQMVTGGASDPTPWTYTYQTRQISNEFQINGKLLESRLRYLFGLYASQDDEGQTIRFNVGGDYPGGTAANGLFLYDFQTTDKSKAVFLQTTYAFSPLLNFTAGGRYTWETVGIEQRADDLYHGLGVAPASATASKPSWTLGLDYKITDDLMVYFDQRGSWRTGGFNGTSATSVDGTLVANQFKPETTYDFELGTKFAGFLGPVHARVNLALYDQYVAHVQRTVYINVAAVSGNVNNARVEGVEFDSQFDLAHWLQVGSAFAYTNAQYTNPQATVAGTSLPFGPYADTPKYSGSAYFRAVTDLGDKVGELALRGDLYAQSSTYYTNLANTLTPGTQISGYHLLNSRLEWNRILGSPVSAAGYVRNLTGEKYYAGGLGLGAVIGVNGTLVGEPRMVGLELSADF